jgi:hypothetical protein
MHGTHPPEHLKTIHRLGEELDGLIGEQIEAMKRATFVGLTTDENKQYEDRRVKILELVAQLRRLDGAA